MQIWNAGLEYLKEHAIGLDGVLQRLPNSAVFSALKRALYGRECPFFSTRESRLIELE